MFTTSRPASEVMHNLQNDKPPEDPKFRFLSDPERDGKGCEAADNAKDAKDDGRPNDGERKNRKKGRLMISDAFIDENLSHILYGRSNSLFGCAVSRIPSARRGNRGSGQCENCGGGQNVKKSHEDPAGELRPERSFQRNTRERNSYPGPRRQDSRCDSEVPSFQQNFL